MELLKTKVPGLVPVHVPYQGNPLVVTGLLGKQIELALIPPGVAMPQVKAGKLKAVGVSSGRSVWAPDVPPLSSAGVKDFQLEVWAALVGPASLSKAAQDRLNAALVTILESQETRQQLFNQGWQAAAASPAGLKARVQEETKIMEKIISSRGIKME
jgi:tripartite-type tricarboxylate transporter receptor subunit TctC